MKKYLALFTTIVLTTLLTLLFFGSPALSINQSIGAYRESEEFLYNMQQDLISKVTNASDRQRLKNAERAWIKFRDAEVGFYGRYYINSKGGLPLKIKLTDERAIYLQSILKQLPQQPGNNIGPI